jgi:hypothetical protein
MGNELPAVVVGGAETLKCETAPGLTVNVKFWVAFGETPLFAVIVMGYEPAAVVEPLKVAVPLPLSMKLTPVGRVPVLLSPGVGEPEVDTVNDPVVPAVKVVLLPLMMAGA